MPDLNPIPALEVKGTVDIVAATYDVGKVDTAEAAVVGDLQQAGFTLDLTAHTDPDVIVTVTYEYSPDEGKTWRYLGGYTCRGGPATGKDGLPATTAMGWDKLPPKTGAMVRAGVTISGKSLDTSGQLWWA